ncbi:MAG: helix-turn-helix domain-containing protein [Candidatus Krumholzibacteriia bacterium]
MADLPEMRTPGERLAQARRDRGASLEQMAEETKIAPRLLQALEHDEYHRVSGPLYARSFLRTYAVALGLDPQEVVGLYERHAGRGEIGDAEEQVWQEETTAVRPVGISYGRLLARYVLPAVLVIVVVAVAFWLWERQGAAPPAGGEQSLLPDTTAVWTRGASPADTLAADAADTIGAAPAAADTAAVAPGGGPGS